ncbi:MAG: hypothetical protein V4555_10125, partial [Acidobacteriota bacterium]
MTALSPKIGVLALQGAYDVHAHRLTALGATSSLVRTPAHLEGLDALVIPGGPLEMVYIRAPRITHT